MVHVKKKRLKLRERKPLAQRHTDGKLMSIESVMPSNHLILCHPLFLPPSIFPNVRVSSNESVLPNITTAIV